MACFFNLIQFVDQFIVIVQHYHENNTIPTIRLRITICFDYGNDYRIKQSSKAINTLIYSNMKQKVKVNYTKT